MRGVWGGIDRGENGICEIRRGVCCQVGSVPVHSEQCLGKTGRTGAARKGGALWAKRDGDYIKGIHSGKGTSRLVSTKRRRGVGGKEGGGRTSLSLGPTVANPSGASWPNFVERMWRFSRRSVSLPMRSFLVWRRGKWGKWGEREEGMKESVARGGRGGERGAGGGAEDRGRGRTGPRNRETRGLEVG